ncbi:aminocarboxymuconate-semialdehyde decarboxylase [Enhydrobacter aerosaccus]|uniref:Aminocarboxymuconate-semialdehyde decarboxylase n=1 Tax=Enhydrobacter aerosaccus TaxID=225324 RepID=A0A1T4K9E8_9HYPH|nr:amidohydrolase family protein [Enhydrobacter aerosaccus]SJZ39072.1 aminocarboxymuconate-semialdehyde decarboxylase [Enhydrobacter aerosaccus]
MMTSGATSIGSRFNGIAFTGCPFAAPRPAPHAAEQGHGHAHAHAGAGSRRREVVVKGTRVKTVDIHAHCAVPAAMALVKHPLEAPGLLMTDVDTRLAAMDAQGIDVEALSINPFWYRAERDVAAELIRLQNETLAEYCAEQPERFVGFATAALQHPDLAAEQVEHAVRQLGFRGVGVGGSVAGLELADPKFHPFWAKCEELGVLVFLHPLGTRELEPSGRLGGSGLLTNTIGNPLETTLALSHLIFEGTLDRFPGLKICAAHGGGFLPSYANRSDAVIRTFPNRVGPLPKKKPTAYLRDGQLFFDTIVFTPEALCHLIAETGASQIMIGTDYPFPWTSTEIDLVLNTPGLSDDERIAILGGTAAKLLGL